VCKAIADPKRLLIINELRDRELSVSDLCEALDLTQSNVSQHLAILRERGVVSTRRVGTSVIYTLRGTKVLQAVDLLREFLADDLAERGRLSHEITG
jgi:ArsR family transcriptional regulator